MVPFERFAAFHETFNGEGSGIWNICAQCGGRCEIYKIGTLLPGEKEYMAAGLNLPIEVLEAHYLDRLVTPRGTVDVLKLKPGCPFLDANYHCTLAERKVKPVLCEIYPVMFSVEQIGGTASEPQLKVNFEIDELDCPLVHRHSEWGGRKIDNPNFETYRQYFQEHGIPLLQQLDVAPEFYWIVAQYDEGNFDYRALAQRRHVPVNQYDTFTLDEVLACDLGHDL
ncbi:MAG: YkgJ family cysteine cluster protein [Anaerolineae bacterium]|nr:YkgJ family cysteine cluster protein [Anaerolineae bacterium]